MPEYESEFMRKKMKKADDALAEQPAEIEQIEESQSISSGLEALMARLEPGMKIMIGTTNEIKQTLEDAEHRIEEDYEKADYATREKYDKYKKMLAVMKRDIDAISSKIMPLAEYLRNEIKSLLSNCDSINSRSNKLFLDELPETIRRSAEYSRSASEERCKEISEEADRLIENDREEIEKTKRMKKVREENEKKREGRL